MVPFGCEAHQSTEHISLRGMSVVKQCEEGTYFAENPCCGNIIAVLVYFFCRSSITLAARAARVVIMLGSSKLGDGTAGPWGRGPVAEEVLGPGKGVAEGT